MVEARLELVQAWLAKALHDLGTARKAPRIPTRFSTRRSTTANRLLRSR